MAKVLKKIGIIAMVIGCSVGLFSLSLNTFTLTDTIFQSQVKPEHQAVLAPQLSPMFGKTYSHVFGFSNAISEAIRKVNEQYDKEKKWDKKIYENYELTLSKASASGYVVDNKKIVSFMSLGLVLLGALIYLYSFIQTKTPITDNAIFKNSLTSRNYSAALISIFLISFYIILYFYPAYLTNWLLMIEPLSKALSGGSASQWFLYGFFYTITVLVMGVRMLMKYSHSNYQIIRTLSVMFFQTCFAFLIPEIMLRLNMPSTDLKNMWPLDYSFFFDYRLDEKLHSGTLGLFLLVWGIVLFVVGVPVMTYFFGKRWYCSWVCGCGALAETVGDPWRQLSDKSLKVWKIERYTVHFVLGFAILMTVGVIYAYFTHSYLLLGFIPTQSLKAWYGFYIGSIFSGVIGTGLYPLMGSRVWCRFGCPLAAYLGLVQKYKSKFRISTNGGQCISCGNCSTYCEMGIDVRLYAQKGQDIVRSSCVGCGICAAVCPRGVLKLENADPSTRRLEALPFVFGNDLNPTH